MIVEFKNGAYEPIGAEDILEAGGRSFLKALGLRGLRLPEVP